VSWTDPAPDFIINAASLFALALPSFTPYFFDPNVTRVQYTSPDSVDVGLWTQGEQTLILATNLNYFNTTLDLKSLPGMSGVFDGSGWNMYQVLNNTGAVVQGTTVMFDSVGSGAWIVYSPSAAAATGNGTAGGTPANSRVLRAANFELTGLILWLISAVMLTFG
jgi:hypothetical protein